MAEERILTMRLYYFDHVPNDYEPPLFKAAEDDRIFLPDSPVKIKVGDVVTPHHTYVRPLDDHAARPTQAVTMDALGCTRANAATVTHPGCTCASTRARPTLKRWTAWCPTCARQLPALRRYCISVGIGTVHGH